MLVYLGPPDSLPGTGESITDTDGDGMDDAWELSVFGSLLPDGTTDADGDGWTNLEEYHAGSDPMVSGLLISQVPHSAENQPGSADLVVFTPAG